MTRRAFSMTAFAAALSGLLLFIGLLSGHCPRAVLDPHPVAAASAAPVEMTSTAPMAQPADHSCTTESPAVLATAATAPLDAPQMGAALQAAPTAPASSAVATSSPSRAPPPPASASTIDLCVLRV
jgi:hypothetical protein